MRCAELFSDLLAEYRRNERKSIVHAEPRIRIHLWPVFGETRAAEINTHMIHEYIAKRQKAKAKNATINRELEVFQRWLRSPSRCTSRSRRQSDWRTARASVATG